MNARTTHNPMSKAALTATMISISMEDSPPTNFHRRQQVFAFGPRLHNPHLIGCVTSREFERLIGRAREPRLEVVRI